MNPILIIALTVLALSLPVIAFVVMHTRRITRLHALALSEQQRTAGECLDAVHREHRREYAALHRDTHGKIEEQRASIQELVKHNKRLMTDLAEARIQALPLHDDPFALDDRQVLMTASTQLMILKELCIANPALAPLLSPSNVQRVLDELEKVLARVTRHLSADGTLLIQPATTMTRDQYGYWSHPHLPQFSEATTTERLAAWQRVQRLEVRLIGDHREVSDDQDGYDLSSFEPLPPEGDGWFLLSIHDTEDGAAAWYARRLVEVPAATPEAAA